MPFGGSGFFRSFSAISSHPSASSAWRAPMAPPAFSARAKPNSAALAAWKIAFSVSPVRMAFSHAVSCSVFRSKR